MLKVVGLLTSDLLNTSTNNCQQICDGCGKHYFLSSSLRQFRRYTNVELCVDCYGIPQIKEATSSMLFQLRMLDIKMNRMTCSICAMGLIDSQSCYEIAGFKRDYVDVFCTEDTIWDMVQNGSTWDVTRAAHEKTRNVCLQCFSAISYAKNLVGISRLRRLQLSDDIKHAATKKVEDALRLLLKTDEKTN